MKTSKNLRTKVQTTDPRRRGIRLKSGVRAGGDGDRLYNSQNQHYVRGDGELEQVDI